MVDWDHPVEALVLRDELIEAGAKAAFANSGWANSSWDTAKLSRGIYRGEQTDALDAMLDVLEANAQQWALMVYDHEGLITPDIPEVEALIGALRRLPLD